MTQSPLQPAQIDWKNQGTPVSKLFDDVYFSTAGGLNETRYVFLAGNQLPERFYSHQEPTFIVAETGFGTGLNFLVLWQLFLQFRAQHPDAPLKKLRFISFERHPLTAKDIVTAQAFFPSLTPQATQLQNNWPALNGGASCSYLGGCSTEFNLRRCQYNDHST